VRDRQVHGKASFRSSPLASCVCSPCLAFPPLLLLLYKSPLALVVLYAITGSFFLPFLAAVLLVLNNRADLLGPLRNGRPANALLALCLALFSVLFVLEARDALSPR
jgi:Mn2+/Fe2+ NRAMP family transporter